MRIRIKFIKVSKEEEKIRTESILRVCREALAMQRHKEVAYGFNDVANDEKVIEYTQLPRLSGIENYSESNVSSVSTSNPSLPVGRSK